MTTLLKIIIVNSRLLCLAMMLVLMVPPSAAFSENNDYAEKLVRDAVLLKLHEERGWLALLHYGKGFIGTYKSRIDDKNFFMSPVGRFDAGAELEATLRSFFVSGAKDGQSSICRFPARYAWLAERLHIDRDQLPAALCTERDASLGAIDAKSAVLVFPVGHINSPASMFGHTLIRIDGSSKSSLISYAVNYSAANTDANGFKYAWKGLAGMYKGFYSLMPYYEKVREYNDLEHRDMWEYTLNLTEPEVRVMLNHIWELQNIESSYYFLDENCSYNLMFLIEVARPDLHLTDQAGFFVLPTDTVRAAMESGIVSGVKYRASQGAKIRKMLSLLDPAGQQFAYDISFQRYDPAQLKRLLLADVEKIKILDLASGFVQFRFGRKEIEKDLYSRSYLKILGERSALGAAPGDLYRIVEPARPDEGHGTTKVSVATGVHRGKLFGELNVRPEFHALLDPDQGYLPGAQIKFFDTAIRYGGNFEKVFLKTLHVIDIISVSPRDTFFKPISWKVNTGFDIEMLRDRQEHLIYRLNTGGGFSYETPFGGIAYMLGELDVNASPEFHDSFAAGPGLSVGVTEQLSGSFNLLMNISGVWYGLGDDRSSVKSSIAVNQRMSQHNSLSYEVFHEYVNGQPISEFSLRWNCYY